MALEYTLYQGNLQFNLDTIIRILNKKKINYKIEERDHLSIFNLNADYGIILSCSHRFQKRVEYLFTKSRIEEKILVNIMIYTFRISSEFNHSVSKNMMIEIVRELVTGSKADALFIFNSDVMIFQKENELLQFNPDSFFFNSYELQQQLKLF